MAADRVKGITIEIGGDTTALSKALSGVNKDISSTQKQLKDVERLLKLDPTNTELLAQKQRLLKEAVSETKEKLDTLKDAEKQVQQQFKEGKVSQEQYDSLQREIIATEQNLRRLKEEAIESNAALVKIADIGDKLEKAGDKIAGVGQDLLKVTAGVTALGTAAVKTTSDFDTSMSQVQATMGITSDAVSSVNGETVNTLEALRDLAKQMGSQTAFSASECAEAINYLALAGYDAQEIYETLPTVLNLAAAGTIDLASASDMVTDAMSALGMETSEADKMVDQMAKTASSTNTSVAQLGDAILTIGATAKTIKGGTAELNTALGILANNGIKGSEGGTHLRNVILALQSPTDEAAMSMESLGVQVYDAEGNMKSLNNILGDLSESMDGMTSEEKQNIISSIFNKTDLAAVNSLLANTGETWDNLQEAITSSGGAAQNMADTQLDNLNGQVTILKSAIEGLAISFGEVLMPTIKSIVAKAQEFVDKLNNMDESQRNVIVQVAAIVAAIGPFLLVLGKIISSVGSLMTGFSSLAKGIGTLTTTVIPGIGSAISWLAANPIALVIAAIVGLVVLIAKKGDEIQAIIQKVDDFLQNVFATDWIKIFGPILGESLNSFFANLKNIWDSIKQVFNGIIDFIRGVFTRDWERVWNGVKEIFGGIFDGLKSVAKAPLNAVIGLVNTAISGINGVIKLLNKIPGVDIGEIGKIPYLANGGIVTSGRAVVGEDGPELLTVAGGKTIVQPLTNNTTHNTSLGGVNVYVYGAPGQDVNELADAVAERIEDLAQRKDAVFA